MKWGGNTVSLQLQTTYEWIKSKWWCKRLIMIIYFINRHTLIINTRSSTQITPQEVWRWCNLIINILYYIYTVNTDTCKIPLQRLDFQISWMIATTGDFPRPTLWLLKQHLLWCVCLVWFNAYHTRKYPF